MVACESCLKLIQVDAETNYSSSANISSSCDVVMAMVFRKLEMFTDTNMGHYAKSQLSG